MYYRKTDKQIEQEMINKFFDDIWAKKVKVVEELIKSNKYKTEGIIILCCYIGAISYERFGTSNRKTTDRDAYKKMLLNYSGLDLYQKIDLLFFYKWPDSEKEMAENLKIYIKIFWPTTNPVIPARILVRYKQKI